MNTNENVLEFRKVSKVYPGVVAIDQIDMYLRRGEILGLVGENGAGKSTLIKTCAGAVSPSSGEIVIDGKTYHSLTAELSQKLGIGTVYQEFNLISQMSVWENLFLSDFKRKRGKRDPFIDRKTMKKAANELLREKFGLDINVDIPVGYLSVGYQQLIEIAKELVKGSRIIFMDEPSAPLSDKEVKILFRIVRQLRDEGISIIYISHRLEEIFEICDRVSVMRDGKLIKTGDVKEFDYDQLIALMVGREIKEIYPKRTDAAIGDTILKLDKLTGNGVQDISFEVKSGEVFGLAGLVGAGRTELAQMLYGIVKPVSGTIYFKGKPITLKNPLSAIRLHFGLVPEKRKEEGIALEMGVDENITLAVLPKISGKLTFVNRQKRNVMVKSYIEALNIKISDAKRPVKTLSGGNQQKVVLAKALATEPEVIILDEPTRGIDVGAKREIYELVNEMTRQGKTIIIISSEMTELIGMCDRMAILSEGRLTGVIGKNEFDQETILHYASI